MSDKITISPELLSGAISEQLGLYQKDVQKKIDKYTKQAADDLVRITKDTAPYNVKHHGRHFVDCIASKKENSKTGVSTYVWYVKPPCYRLTHLLVKGHKTILGTGKSRKKDGTDKTKKSNFLKDAQEKVYPDFENNIIKAVKGDGS